ncbi:MAG: DUF5678 domain-containing protein [archaeon]
MAQLVQEKNYEYFMQADVGRFIGEWIAIADNKVIAHGKDVKAVAAKAQEITGSKKFLLAKVPSQEAMIF